MAENSTMTKTANGEHTGVESTRGGFYYAPRVDIYEDDKELTLFADVPGVQADDVELRYERGQLFLHARIEPRDGQNYLLHEFEIGDFYRVFDIHESVDSGRIAAECKDGVLTVHLPKVETVRPTQIKVRAQ